MKVYKIRDENGLYSNGGMSPEFTREGKTWNNIGHLKNHLRQFFDRTNFRGTARRAELYKNASIVEIEVSESMVGETSAMSLIVEMLEGDVKEVQKLADKYPTSPYYPRNLDEIKDQLAIMKGIRDETR